MVSVSVDIFRRVESNAVFKRFKSLQPSIKLLENSEVSISHNNGVQPSAEIYSNNLGRFLETSKDEP